MFIHYDDLLLVKDLAFLFMVFLFIYVIRAYYDSKEIRQRIEKYRSSTARICKIRYFFITFLLFCYIPFFMLDNTISMYFNTTGSITALYLIVSNLGMNSITLFYMIQSWIISLTSIWFYNSTNNPDVNDKELLKSAIEIANKSKKVELTNEKILDEIKDHLKTQDEKMNEIKQMLQALAQKSN